MHKPVFSTPDTSAGYKEIEAQMTRVLRQQRELQLSVDRLRTATADLGQAVRMTSMQEGLMALFDLWGALNRHSGDLNDYYADLLLNALKLLGAEPVIPVTGDIYDPLCHLKSVFSSESTEIAACEKCNWGWKFNDIILRKAVVEINEKSEEGSE